MRALPLREVRVTESAKERLLGLADQRLGRKGGRLAALAGLIEVLGDEDGAAN